MKSSHKAFRLPSSFLRTAALLGGMLFAISVPVEAQTASPGIVIMNGTTNQLDNYQIIATGSQSGIEISRGTTLYLDYDSTLMAPKNTASTIKVASGRFGIYVTGSSSASTLVAANTSIETSGSTSSHAIYTDSSTGKIVLYNIGTITASGRGIAANKGQIRLNIADDGSAWSPTNDTVVRSDGNGVTALDNSQVSITHVAEITTAQDGLWANTGGVIRLNVNATGNAYADTPRTAITSVGYGMRVDKGSSAIADNVSISTSGDGSHGLYANGIADDRVSVALSNATITTSGATAYGAYANAARITIADSIVNTTGHGLYALASGSIVARNTTITSSGSGAYITSGGQAVINGGEINVAGDGLYATGSSSTILVDETNITSTSGAGAVAVNAAKIWINADATGVATGNDSQITVTGDSNIAGLSAIGTNSQITAAKLVINAQDGAYGVTADGKNATIYMTDGSITTQGRAVNALSGSLVSLNGTLVYLNGADTRGLYANQSTINATGVTVLASQSGIQAIYAYNDGRVSLTDSTVTVEGSGSFGIYANTGVIDVQGSFIHVSESGTGSHAIGAVAGGFVNINGGVEILTEAEKSYGIFASSGSGIATININKPVSISTTYEGNPNNWDNSLWNNAAYCIFGDAGARITISTGGEISTKGYFANAINANGVNGSITANNVTLTTQGGYAAGAYVRAGSALTLNNATIQTSGVGASGIVISGSSSLSLGGTNRIHTSGVGAHGFSAVWGADFTLGNSTSMLPKITLNGTDSALVYVTGGEFSHTAEIKPSTLTLNNVNLLTNNTLGTGNWGAKAENSGTLIFTNGSNTGGTKLWATGVADYSYFAKSTDVEPVHTGPLYGTIVFKDSSKADGSLVLLDAYGILDITGTDSGLNIGALNGAGTAKLGDKTLTIGGYVSEADSSDSVFSGNIYGDLGGIVKTGSGSFTLNGGHGTYTGGTTSIVDGSFNITNGGTISDNEGRIGKSGGATAVLGYVDGSGSRWSNSGNLYVGENGNASLSINNGGAVVAQETQFNAAATGTSTMLIQGQSGENRSVLETGKLTKSSGSGKANVTIDGGELRATRNNGQFISGFDSGSITVGNGGAYINTQQYNVGVGAGSFSGRGTIFKTGTGVLAMGGTGYTNAANNIAIHVQQGVLAVANMSDDGATLSISTLNTNGNIVFDSGTAYRVLIGQSSTVNSSTNLGGSGTFQIGSNVGLILDVDSQYYAREGDYFDIASNLSSTAIGAFTAPESGISIGGMDFEISYGDSYIRLQAVPEPSTYALIAGVVVLGVVVVRRKRRNAA